MVHDYEALIPEREHGASIAHNIFQIYIGREGVSIAPELQSSAQSLRDRNPLWQYHLYRDREAEQFVREEYGEVVWSYLQRINPIYAAARADLLRYLLLYRYGGVYLDLKTTVDIPLDVFLRPDDTYILSHWDNLPGQLHEGVGLHGELEEVLPRGEYQQFFICAAAGHPFLRRVLIDILQRMDNYRLFEIGVGGRAVYRVTGPIGYSLSIVEAMRRDPCLRYRVVDCGHEPQSGIVYSIYERGASKATDDHIRAIGSIYRTSTVPLLTTVPWYEAWAYRVYQVVYLCTYDLIKLLGLVSLFKKFLKPS